MPLRHALSALILTVLALPPASGQDGGARIKNPYFDTCQWRLWAENPAPIEDARAYVPPDKAPPSTIQPPPPEKRLWPQDLTGDAAWLGLVTTPSKRYAGTWDDVYASWSGTHGYVRDEWKGPDGSAAKGIKSGIIHLVDEDKAGNFLKCGINFFHQSTTGMGHTIANAVAPSTTAAYEKMYFASGLICAPAHVSHTEENAGRSAQTLDLYMAYMPTYFNSVGSSNSETMAITKMIIAGAHLSPDLKLRLKRHGLYASTMLWLWKSCLPIDAPYDTEWIHRIAYKSVGDRFAFPGGYGAAGIERGDAALDWHRYDDVAHLRAMVEQARSLTEPPPEAILNLVEQKGGTLVYALKKTVLVVQRPGEEVVLTIDAGGSYDLDDRPLSFRWSLLYGNRSASAEREAGTNRWTLRIPWDDALPEGRTTFILVANNGAHDGNPAAVNVWRQSGSALPDTGFGYQDYKYDLKPANRRPALVGLQSVTARPGETVRIPLTGIDPEGFPVRFAKRAGEPGAFDGSTFVWEVPRGTEAGDVPLTILASDGTSGNSYEAQRIRIRIAPRTFARIAADRTVGPAPLALSLTAEGSFDAGGKSLTYEWAVVPRAAGAPAMPKAESTAAAFSKTLDKPGVYDVWLKVKGPSGEDATMMRVLVTDGAAPAPKGGVVIEGRGVRIADGDDSPGEFDGTHVGGVKGGAFADRDFLVFNTGAEPADLGRKGATVSGEHAAEFAIVQAPRSRLERGESTRLTIRFTPKGPGERRAVVEIAGRRFSIAGTGIIDQAAVDRAAAADWAAARRLADQKSWAKALMSLREFLAKWPSATAAPEARALLERLEADPAVKAALADAEADAQAAKEREAQDGEARRLWNLAHNCRLNGLTERAKSYWREIVDKFPKSTFADQAREELKRHR